ncbi:MAG: S8 family serine peptidase [Phycisphaerae bacterium]|nr:S8 family serine peptidase [Phycisphaerae bacterium]
MRGPVKTWVFFTDKGIDSATEYRAAIRQVAQSYNERAKQRRMLRGANVARGGELFGEYDLPVVVDYVDAVTATGARVHVTSRWLNAVSVWATKPQLDRIARLPFVTKLQLVARSRRVEPMGVRELGAGPFPVSHPDGSRGRLDYGLSTGQLAQIDLIALHEAGFTGDGVVIGILDTGFRRTHEAFNEPGYVVNVVAEWDFVDNDPDAGMEPDDHVSQHRHGTLILGCLGAYKPGSLIGGAYNASFILCKTEDIAGEYPAEEDNFVAGLEFIEANGGDVSTASLGYIDWYNQGDFDGRTAVTTIAVNISTMLGVHHCNAAGNESHDSDPATSSLIAPADALWGITCGAVDSDGVIAGFSSDGPTADGRVKPELLACGSGTHTVSPSTDTEYAIASGTSLSTPLVASAVACLIQARPYWTVEQMRENLFHTADYYVANGTYDPLYVLGYGIVDALAAYSFCPDAGTIELDRDKYTCQTTVRITVMDCGLNFDDHAIDAVQVTIASDSEPGGETILLTETQADSAQFSGSINLSLTDAPGVLLVAEGGTITATYIDEDDGAGGCNVEVTDTAVVDCHPPVISNVRTTDVQPLRVKVAFDADEPVRGIVQYGLSCNDLDETVSGIDYTTAPVVDVLCLEDDTTYFYAVEAEDQASNSTTDDNGGACYSFTTPNIPELFTELFGNDIFHDLGHLSLTFTPDGSSDYYAGCVVEIAALPTDPSGGTAIPLSDDDYQYVNLNSDETVLLYGISSNGFYVGANGYVTFTAGDTDNTSSFENHFNMPRISGLFHNLDPSAGGSVSWKQLPDRAVVTYQDVPEHGSTEPNTFQIEMFFDETITISCLGISTDFGLVGLSEGNGYNPETFIETNLSALDACGPRPPSAGSDSVSTPANTPLTITLVAADDGLPDPPAALTYTILSLPANGTLSDPGADVISSVPYTLVGGGNEVIYTPDWWAIGQDGFTFKANDGGTSPTGGDSNVATISIEVTLQAPELAYSFPLDSNPGWATEGLWAFGQPTGGGSHNGDPNAGYTGDNVYGYNLDGDYTNDMPAYHLTTTPIDCSDLCAVELRFWRWVGVESSDYDRVAVEVSTNGSTWATIAENPSYPISDGSWKQMLLDISNMADGEPAVYVRWVMGSTDDSVTYPGWNLDDVEIWGVDTGQSSPCDLDADGDVDLDDFNIFAGCLIGPEVPVEPACEPADFDGDDDVDLQDFAVFQNAFTG